MIALRRLSQLWALSLFIFIGLTPTELSPNHPPVLILWNVGQGQWATLSESQRCWHVDMGGEQASWDKIFQECRGKEQWVSFSHWDWDHLSFVRTAHRVWPSLCLYHRPLGSTTPARQNLLDRLRPCSLSPEIESQFAIQVQEIQWQETLPHPGRLKSNELSRVFVAGTRTKTRQVLLPGDSFRQQEKLWLRQLPRFQPIHTLVLGHHGSRTSTSPQLLQALPHLELSLISARRARYSHPHPVVIDRLRNFKKPWISTEDFGHLRILLE